MPEKKRDPFEDAIIAIDGAINALVTARIVMEYASKGQEPPAMLAGPEPEEEDGGECRHRWQRMPDRSLFCLECGEAG